MSGRPVQMRQRIALFQHVAYGFVNIFTEDVQSSAGDYVRVSEFVDVDFRPLTRDEVMRNAAVAFDNAEREIRLELGKRLAALADRRAQIMALPAPEAAA